MNSKVEWEVSARPELLSTELTANGDSAGLDSAVSGEAGEPTCGCCPIKSEHADEGSGRTYHG